MIGTWLRLRSCRHTSMPDDLRQHHVEQHEVGVDGVEQVEGLGAVAGDLHAEALAPQADRQRLDEADSSSSTTSTVVCGHAHASTCLRHRCTATGPGPAGMRSVNVEPSPSLRRRPTRCRRGWWRRGARWPGRGRCRRSPGCGPGRRGRSARRCGRGRAPGCRCRGRRRRCRPTCRRCGPRPRPCEPGSEYFTPFSTRLASADTSWRRSPTTLSRRDGSTHVDRDARAARPAAGPARRPRRRPGRRSTTSRWRRLAELDARQLQQVLDVRPTRWASVTIFSASRLHDARTRPRRPAPRPAGPGRRPASSARG